MEKKLMYSQKDKKIDIPIMLLAIVSISGLIMFFGVHELVGSVMVLFSFGTYVMISVIRWQDKKKEKKNEVF